LQIEPVKPQSVVIVADTTFFKRTAGICVFRSPYLKKNLYWSEVTSETIAIYQTAKQKLEEDGFQITAIVLDGKPGVRTVFSNIPIQMCHFHQKMIVNRHLTTRPKLEAGKELRHIAMTLCDTTEEEFEQKLKTWYKKWSKFLKEKTIDDATTGEWHYTHKRLRSAYRSLISNLPYLFTYQKHPELNIPNTTNSLDGSFAHLKNLITIHRGLNSVIKRKIITEILGK